MHIFFWVDIQLNTSNLVFTLDRDLDSLFCTGTHFQKLWLSLNQRL